MNPLETLNISRVSEITTNQFIELANNTFTIPSIITIFIFMSLIFLFIGLILVRNSRGKFMIIWFASFVINLIFLLLMVFLPNWFFDNYQLIKSWFS